MKSGNETLEQESKNTQANSLTVPHPQLHHSRSYGEISVNTSFIFIPLTNLYSCDSLINLYKKKEKNRLTHCNPDQAVTKDQY